ncbi:hypothetical protein LIER_43920 [Lithospermum erythrorhizon]|uniref:Retrovirus-related Pol polyprotein from transposon TNT 1-94 n=1 Tax=Lithospermum erythrorhizon TaxID=34254 RepID=A0AAV3R9X0_LITER
MSDENSLIKVPTFEGHYDHWSELMENILKAKGLWGMIERDHSTSKIIWESLKNKYSENEKVKKAIRNSLRREFEIAKMKRGETVEDYFGRITAIANKLRSNGEEMKDQVIVEKILRTFSDQFTYIVVSKEKSHNIEEMTVDELQGTLNLHEKKFDRPKKDKGDQVLQVEEKYGGRSCRGRGSYRRRGRGGFSTGVLEINEN